MGLIVDKELTNTHTDDNDDDDNDGSDDDDNDGYDANAAGEDQDKVCLERFFRYIRPKIAASLVTRERDIFRAIDSRGEKKTKAAHCLDPSSDVLSALEWVCWAALVHPSQRLHWQERFQGCSKACCTTSQGRHVGHRLRCRRWRPGQSRPPARVPRHDGARQHDCQCPRAQVQCAAPIFVRIFWAVGLKHTLALLLLLRCIYEEY